MQEEMQHNEQEENQQYEGEHQQQYEGEETGTLILPSSSYPSFFFLSFLLLINSSYAYVLQGEYSGETTHEMEQQEEEQQ